MTWDRKKEVSCSSDATLLLGYPSKIKIFVLNITLVAFFMI